MLQKLRLYAGQAVINENRLLRLRLTLGEADDVLLNIHQVMEEYYRTSDCVMVYSELKLEPGLLGRHFVETALNGLVVVIVS